MPPLPASQRMSLPQASPYPPVFHTDDRSGFIGSEHMSYLCFFTREEAADGWNGAGPAYSAWSGARSR